MTQEERKAKASKVLSQWFQTNPEVMVEVKRMRKEAYNDYGPNSIEYKMVMVQARNLFRTSAPAEVRQALTTFRISIIPFRTW